MKQEREESERNERKLAKEKQSPKIIILIYQMKKLN